MDCTDKILNKSTSTLKLQIYIDICGIVRDWIPLEAVDRPCWRTVS